MHYRKAIPARFSERKNKNDFYHDFDQLDEAKWMETLVVENTRARSTANDSRDERCVGRVTHARWCRLSNAWQTTADMT